MGTVPRLPPPALERLRSTISASALPCQERPNTAFTNPLWDFYTSGLVDEDNEDSGDEDTEDELETQDWILFQRQRAQARLANACQREAYVVHTTKR
ncbi:unnamed protein product [Peronospora belbahrii]|uniref:Uncharacterized protein n=1 Tax=Peronospora belbahrii TaxID=622444 RepID=A0ABN8D657_9STRA|nr:unnamed protein product [Peronospora belbahrii]